MNRLFIESQINRVAPEQSWVPDAPRSSTSSLSTSEAAKRRKNMFSATRLI
jgi:hypothetical protein